MKQDLNEMKNEEVKWRARKGRFVRVKGGWVGGRRGGGRKGGGGRRGGIRCARRGGGG